MVSESKILGKSSLIFVTVGSTNFQFNRLFSAVDNAINNLSVQPCLVVQMGNSDYKWRYKKVKTYKYLTPNEMIKIIKKSDRIITHGGFGSMYLITKYNQNMPFIVSRLKYFGEHVDDHQRFFLEYIKNKIPDNYRKYFFMNGNLASEIQVYLNSKPQKNVLDKYLFDEKSKYGLINKLQKYIESI